jgi:phosphoenolpyruvate carboxykinase (GTP)
MRDLKWIFERVQGRAEGTANPLGTTPRYEDLDWQGLDGFERAAFERLTKIDGPAWVEESRSHRESLAKFGDRIPSEMMACNERLLVRSTDQATQGS